MVVKNALEGYKDAAVYWKLKILRLSFFDIWWRGWIVLKSCGKVRSVWPFPGSQGQEMGQKVKWRIRPQRTNKVQKWIPGIFLVKMTPSSCQSDQGSLRYEFLKFYLFVTECENPKISKCHNSVTNWLIELKFWIFTCLNRPDIHAKFHQNWWWWGVGLKVWVIWHGMTLLRVQGESRNKIATRAGF